ncbi:MAG: purine-binding chemotaxis protein CheW [Candidatus Lindowbacteria bacterium]|nr:purine-binding chemotaxis protein CheW [Candidatus Lindowbacteria bacterium]
MTFQVGEEKYALDMTLIHEIMIPESVTALPNLPDFMEGIITLRGDVIPIVDLRERFGSSRTNVESRVLIAEVSNVVVGLRVDSVSKVYNVKEGKMKATPRIISALGSRVVSSVFELSEDAGGGFFLVLDIEKIFEAEEWEALQTTTDGQEPDQKMVDGTYDEVSGLEESAADSGDEESGGEQILEFTMRGQHYGVKIVNILEVIQYIEPTDVFFTPPFILGVINLRGDIVSLFDFAAFFDLKAPELTEKSRVLIISYDESGVRQTAGFLVEEVVGTRFIDASRSCPPPATIQEEQRQYISGIVEEDHGPLILLYVESIFASKKVVGL